jgi:hypothetical protein
VSQQVVEETAARLSLCCTLRFKGVKKYIFKNIIP